MTVPRILWLASLIATMLETGGSISLARLEADLQKRHPSITQYEFYAAVHLGVANGKIMRTFGGAALAKTS